MCTGYVGGDIHIVANTSYLTNVTVWEEWECSEVVTLLHCMV